MDNQCFVIMPAGEQAGYPQGHFGRVYDYVIIPACRAAGFWPSRVDNLGSSDPMEAIKGLVNADIAIFDLSANQQDARYGLAIRTALNLPSIVLKDIKTYVSLGGEYKVVEYDDSLRIDTVQKETSALSEELKNAVENRTSKHDALIQLGVGSPPVSSTATTESEGVASEPVIEDIKPKAPALPIIDPIPDYVGDSLTELDIEKIKAGDILFHMNHGRGEIKTIRKVGNDRMAEIIFESGNKILMVGTSGYFRKVK